MRTIGTSVAVVAALAVASAANADLLWDNDIQANGINARAVSPPGFPDIRVSDDFTVSGGNGLIQGAHFTLVEDGNWTRGDSLQIWIYEDNGGMPGAEVVSYSGSYTATATGEQLFSRDVYNYWIDFEADLADGTYHVGVRNVDGGGTGTNYWATSNGGEGTAAEGTYSLDNGGTWQTEGDTWHHAFEIHGVPAPGALALLGLAGLMRRRRR